MRPRLLDLFCGAGGAAKGYQRAGFYVAGVDIEPQPNYCGDEFVQADALGAIDDLIRGNRLADAVHASPPCPRHSFVTGFHPGVREQHPDLIAPCREMLDEAGVPYVIENVPGAPVRKDLMLCGEQFGLRVHRHRYFELGGWFTLQAPHSTHRLKGGRTNCHVEDGHARWITGHYADHEDASEAMGIDWMTRDELPLAIPPAYTEYIGHDLMRQVLAEAA